MSVLRAAIRRRPDGPVGRALVLLLLWWRLLLLLLILLIGTAGAVRIMRAFRTAIRRRSYGAVSGARQRQGGDLTACALPKLGTFGAAIGVGTDRPVTRAHLLDFTTDTLLGQRGALRAAAGSLLELHSFRAAIRRRAHRL